MCLLYAFEKSLSISLPSSSYIFTSKVPRDRPVRPVRASSRISTSFSIRRKASSLLWLPTSSITSDSMDTSTIFALKISAMDIIFCRLLSSQSTFTRISSRHTELSGSSFLISTTSSSLFNCFFDLIKNRVISSGHDRCP